MSAEQLVEGLAVALGKTLHPEQLTLIAEDGQDRHKQHPPLRVANPPAQTTNGKRLKEADQILCSGGVLYGETKRFGRGLRTKPELTAARQGYRDRLLIDPGLTTFAAAYLELALRLGLPLSSRDQALNAAASQEGVPLLSA